MTEIDGVIFTALSSGVVSAVVAAYINAKCANSKMIFEATLRAASEISATMYVLERSLRDGSLNLEEFSVFVEKIKGIRSSCWLFFTEKERAQLMTVDGLATLLKDGEFPSDKRISFESIEEIILPIVENFRKFSASVERRYRNDASVLPSVGGRN